VVAVAALAAGFLPARPAVAAQDPWEDFLADRVSLYTQLAPPILDCFQRHDSAIDPLSPVFHGCIDWHSASHAAYSHHALFRRTGSQDYLDRAEAQIAPGGVSLFPAEMAYERAKGLDLPLTENPYGFGWFLILARERELATGKQDARAMADYAANEMVAWFRAREVNNDARTYILNEAHPNYSWSLLNLDVWARYTNDPALLAAVRDAARPLFEANLDTSCPATRDRQTTRTGFMPACIMRLATVAHIFGDHVRDWILARLPAEGLNIPPVTAPANCHAGGLNFTRPFALYQLYLVTGDASYRDNYVDLIRYHVGRPDLYIDPDYLGDPGYLCYSHWVAQVGVRSISQSYEARPPTPAFPPPAAVTTAGVQDAVVTGSAVDVTGSASFADQPFVELGTDPTGDAEVPAALGQDLTAASVSTTTDGRLRLRFHLASLPAGTGQGPRVSYGWAFCVSGASCYEVNAWSVGPSLRAEAEVWRCADPACAVAAQTLTTIPAGVTLSPPARTVTVTVPLASLGGGFGSAIAPTAAPVATGIGARRTAGDALAYQESFETGLRAVSLAVGPPGQDPAAVTYASEAQAEDDGQYAGTVDAAGMPPGPAAVYVRACFGANACGYVSRPISL
jgi:hypothetical protein